jgi:hypothetical protein
MLKTAMMTAGFALLLAAAPPATAMPDAAAFAAAGGMPQSSAFRRCMRAKYGPRYFARVPRAHRYHMAQACA